jgi:hypothetical protein
MSSKEKGYVYILTNPSFREDWVKIGKSSRPVNLRSRELDNTAVPLPFEIFATIETVKYNEVEKLVHKTIDRLTDLRIRQNREFFNVPPQIALDIFRDIATTIDDALVVEYRDNKPLHPTTPLPATASPSISEDCENNDFISDDIETDRQPRKMTRARFRFSMIGVKIGEYVTFIPTNTPVKVASDNTVEHEGRIYKLSPFVGTFMPEEIRNTSGAYQGPKYFSYNGRTLEDIRKELEQNSEH